MPGTTKQELQALVILYQKAITSITGEIPELQLHIGSKTYGNAFRLVHMIRDDHGFHMDSKSFWGDISGNGFLGWTKAEAAHTLRTTIHTITSVHQYMQS